MIKIGLVGLGHLGKIHLKNLLELSHLFEVKAVFDEDNSIRHEISNLYNVPEVGSYQELLEMCEAIIIVTPTVSHFELAVEAIKRRLPVFVEKPMVETMDEAKRLVSLIDEAGVHVQVGHVERFNPAFLAAQNHLDSPMFIETHRLAQFNPRGTDVPVVLDLMIHDIDIVLSVVKSRVKKISASGVSIVSDSHDIANARIEFENGCVANLTSSRLSLKNMRKSRFFQKDAYISVDFLNKELEVVRMENIHGEPDPFDIILDISKDNSRKKIWIEKPELLQSNAILHELMEFHNSIANNKAPIVNHHAGYDAMEVALEILSLMN
ncbi:MAG: Gfo/Idh/MocA family oxidoreductase [Bacteroidetes bacterium]|nr:Gfo/Idh/MocA family oxidoreductase [Bacteroidota bacterium]